MTTVTECHQMEKDGKIDSIFIKLKFFYVENGADVPSVCRKCFDQYMDIDYINSFIDAVRYADYQGANGLHLDDWMTEQ